jgi:NADH dehydrogenase
LKKQLLIIGGGFAGFWSAISAVRQSREIQKRGEVEITLVNPDNQVTIRQGFNEGLRFELDKYLKPLGVYQIIGRAEVINPEKNEVIVSIAQGLSILHYDYLILAAGGSLKPSNLQGISHTFNLVSFDNAEKLEGHIIDLAKKDFLEEGASTFVIVGSEFTGLETVTGIDQKIRSMEAYYSGKKSDFRIVLLESGNQIASSFSKECR